MDTDRLQRRIDLHTHRRVRDLAVELRPGRVVLRGRAPSYHVKQLAQHAVLGLLGGARLENAIAVEAMA